MIDEIIDGFDFHSVRYYMEQVDWTWHTPDPHVPTIEEMKETAGSLLYDLLADKEINYISTGGFEVRREAYGEISLRFIIEESNGN